MGKDRPENKNALWEADALEIVKFHRFSFVITTLRDAPAEPTAMLPN